MSSNRWLLVVLLMGYAALGHFNRVGISVAGDEMFIPKLGITESQMGWVYTTFLIVYTMGMLPGGWLIDRIGSAHALTLYGVSMGSFVMLTGAVGWVASSPMVLLVCLLVIRGLAGICNAPLHPGAAHVVSDVMTGDRRASANGMVTAGALIGIACCYPAFGWLMDQLTWQWAFVASGSMLVAYSLLWRLVASEDVLSTHQGLDLHVSVPDQSDTEQQEVPPSTTAPIPQADDSPTIWYLIQQGNLWLITLSYAAYSYLQYLFFYWMGYYFKDVLEVPKVEARWASFWIMLAMGAGMAIGGRCTDIACHWLGRTSGRRLIIIAGMGLGAIFGVIGVNVTSLLPALETLGFNVSSLVCISVCLAISMAATGMCEGVFWTTATDIGGKSRGLSGAFMNTGGNVGGLISPVVTPFIAEEIGWPGAITVACVISGVGGLVWLLIRLPSSE